MSILPAPRDHEIAQAIERSTWDPVFYSRFFLRHWFPTPMPWFHRGFLALQTRKARFLKEYPEDLDLLLKYFVFQEDPSDPDSRTFPIFYQQPNGNIQMHMGPNNNTIWPRGFSKTTITNSASHYELTHDPDAFIVQVSESQPMARRQLGNIKYELKSNTLHREAYGDLTPDRSDEERWSADEIQLLTGGIMVAAGRGTQVRGLNFRARRPTKIILDDVEDRDSVATDNLREKTMEWFYGSVAPAGNEMETDDDAALANLQITVLGTILANECLVVSLADDPTFNTIRFGALLPDGTPLWPRKMSEASVLEKKDQYARVGRLDSFYREYLSTLRVDETAKFRKEDIIYAPLPSRASFVEVAIALDPAISNKIGADHSAILVVGRQSNGLVYVLDSWGGPGKTPREQIDAYFHLVQKWNPDKHGVESIAYQAALVHLLREEMFRRGSYFRIIPLTHNVKKEERVEGILQPRYAAGYMRHVRRFPELELQLLEWPNGKKDFPDALSMAVSLLDESAAFATPETIDLEADEYEDLDRVLGPPQF